MTAIIRNNVVTALAADVGTGDGTLSVISADRMPVLQSGQWFPLTLVRKNTNPEEIEVVHVTAVSGTTLTVSRSREGTLPLTFTTGDIAQIRITAGAIAEIEATGMTVEMNGDPMGLPAAINTRVKKGTVGSEKVTTESGPNQSLKDALNARVRKSQLGATEIETADDGQQTLQDSIEARVLKGRIAAERVTTSTGQDQRLDEALDQRVVHVPDIAALRALTGAQDGQAVRMTTTGRAGDFYFNGSDLSGEVTADPQQGIYVPPDSDPTGASGAWVRDFVGPVSVLWFGAGAGVAATDTASIQAALDTGHDVYAPSGEYVLTNDTTLGRVLRLKTPNQRVLGDGKYRTVFKMADRDADGVLYQDDGVNDPPGFVAMFSNFEQSTDVSGVEIFDLCLDYNGAQNKMTRGYGNEAGTEPLEGAYPGTSGTGFARFRAAVYIQKGSGIRVHDCQLKDWPRVSTLLEGPGVGDIQDSHAYLNDVVVTEANPGTNDWDSTGILIMGDECSANVNRFINRSVGADYYTARTTIQISGRNAHACDNTSYRWYRGPIVGNGGYDSVSDSVVCSNNTLYFAKRSVQMLSRSGALVTSGAALRNATITNNTAYLDVSTMSLNGADSQCPCGISMLEIESLGLDGLVIHGNNHYFEAGAQTGQSGISILPTGTGTQNIKNLSIQDNLTVNPPRNGVVCAFMDGLENFTIAGNPTINPGQRDDSTAQDRAGVQIRGVMKRGSVSRNPVFDDRVPHRVTAAAWLIASVGSKDVECVDNSIVCEDGVYDMPLVENANSNVFPFVRGQIPTFVQPTSVCKPGSSVTETGPSQLEYTSTGAAANSWFPRMREGVAIGTVTFPNGAATPDVTGFRWGKTANTAATTITDLINGHEGQVLALLVSDANTTIQNNASIVTASGADITPAAGTTLEFIRIDGAWRQK